MTVTRSLAVWWGEAVKAEYAHAAHGQVKRGGASHRSQTDHGNVKVSAHGRCTFPT
jgi:hypothetical protein